MCVCVLSIVLLIENIALACFKQSSLYVLQNESHAREE